MTTAPCFGQADYDSPKCRDCADVHESHEKTPVSEEDQERPRP